MKVWENSKKLWNTRLRLVFAQHFSFSHETYGSIFVCGPLHHSVCTLDLIITRGDENLVHDVIILPGLFSDLKVVTCVLDCPNPPASMSHSILDDVILKLPYVRDPNTLVTADLTTLVSVQLKFSLGKDLQWPWPHEITVDNSSDRDHT